MGTKGKHQRSHKAKSPRNWVARQMILDRIGVNACGPMKDKRLKHEKELEESWREEDWGEGE